jgi:hypothetical protein
MMDLSVEANGPTAPNTTLIHWILPGLSSPNASIAALTSRASAIAPYAAPGPPAGQTHTYVLTLYDQPANFSVPAEYVPYFKNLTASVYNRVGFNLTAFADKAGLGDPIAADWFLVSNATSATGSVSGAVTATVSTAAVTSPSGAASSSGAAPSSGVTATTSSTAPTASVTRTSGSAVVTVEMAFVMVLGAAGVLLNLV